MPGCGQGTRFIPDPEKPKLTIVGQNDVPRERTKEPPHNSRKDWAGRDDTPSDPPFPEGWYASP